MHQKSLTVSAQHVVIADTATNHTHTKPQKWPLFIYLFFFVFLLFSPFSRFLFLFNIKWIDRIKNKATFSCYQKSSLKRLSVISVFKFLNPIKKKNFLSLENLCYMCGKIFFRFFIKDEPAPEIPCKRRTTSASNNKNERKRIQWICKRCDPYILVYLFAAQLFVAVFIDLLEHVCGGRTVANINQFYFEDQCSLRRYYIASTTITVT